MNIRRLLTLIGFLAALTSMPSGAAPSLLSGPTTEQIQIPGATISFLFSEPMGTADLDITWEGTGIDSARFSCAWVDEIFGFPIPPIKVDCTYTGGLPASTDVRYTLNKGGSGRIKSESGQALPETSGAFRTPGSIQIPCEGTDTNEPMASILLFKEVYYRQASAAAPVFDVTEKASMNAILSSGTNNLPVEPTSVTLRKPDGSTVDLVKLSFDFEEDPGIPFPDFPDSFYLSVAEAPDIEPPSFDSEAALNAAYPNGTYQMIVGLPGGGSVTVALPLNPNPDVPIPQLANYQALQGFDVSQPLTISWNTFVGADDDDFLQLTVTTLDGSLVFSAPDHCKPIELEPTETSITIPAGTFTAATSYLLDLSFTRGTHAGEGTIEGFHEFASLTRTTRVGIGAPNAGPGTAHLTTVKVEANGSVTLTVEGTITSTTAPVTVEGSTDLESWTAVTTVTRAALEGAGGQLDVIDPLPGITPTSYRFYRLAFP